MIETTSMISEKSRKTLICHSEPIHFAQDKLSEESDIIGILRSSAPQNDTMWPFYEGIDFNYLQRLSGITVLVIGDIYESEIRPHND